MVPWSCGKLLAWDVMCVDTIACSYIVSASTETVAVVALAEEREIHYIVSASTETVAVVALAEEREIH